MRDVENSEYKELGNRRCVILPGVCYYTLMVTSMNIGRTRIELGEDENEEYKERAVSIVEDVRRRGLFKTRRPEGKAGDH